MTIKADQSQGTQSILQPPKQHPHDQTPVEKKSDRPLGAEQLVLELMPGQSGQSRSALSKIPVRKRSLASFLPTQDDALDTGFRC